MVGNPRELYFTYPGRFAELTDKEVAKLLGVSSAYTVRNWRRDALAMPRPMPPDHLPGFWKRSKSELMTAMLWTEAALEQYPRGHPGRDKLLSQIEKIRTAIAGRGN